MEKNKFILRTRYKAIMKDGCEFLLNLEPEKCYYFYDQEQSYLIGAIRGDDRIDIDNLKEIVKVYIQEATQTDIKVVIGL